MGQPSWVISSDVVTAALTRQGGQLGPVTFKLGGREIEPYSVAPWWNESVGADIPNVARILRGDLFCMPFGLNLEAYNGERHQVHGESANDAWHFEDFSNTPQQISLHVSMNLQVRRGRLDKWVKLVPGQTVVYQRDRISGMEGPMCLGHHAMLKIPDYEGAARYSCSPWVLGQVAVKPVELPENKGYSSLKTGAVFDDLAQVPTMTGEMADLTRYPRGRGYEDVVALAANPRQELAWNALVFPKEGYVWFALRDPNILASTMLWLSNGGRHYPPWNGRHINILGIEDNTAFYHYGLFDAANPNPHNQRGIKTVLQLSAKEPLEVRYITGVAPIPAGFEKVERIECRGQQAVLIGANGQRVTVAADCGFLKPGK